MVNLPDAKFSAAAFTARPPLHTAAGAGGLVGVAGQKAEFDRRVVGAAPYPLRKASTKNQPKFEHTLYLSFRSRSDASPWANPQVTASTPCHPDS
jgi:hypothetical protein